ncbi:MAG: amidohydrolase [Dehalococcoidia bacterium]|nr:amidohydrolase [Dehalococcoidia bacterium]
MAKMLSKEQSKSAAIRASLRHPVVDTDGHYIELTPLFLDYLRDVGGPAMVERYAGPTPMAMEVQSKVYNLSLAERRDRWIRAPSWWGLPAKNTLDRATAMSPAVLYDRLEELGFDFVVLYPSEALRLPVIPETDLRLAACRAFNHFARDIFKAYADRMTPVGVIPMNTPEEAIAELEYAVRVLGIKAVVLGGSVARPIPAIHRENPALDRIANRQDFFGLDSEYDYDPVWAKCVELKVAVTFHAGQWGWGSRRSISNMMFNHIGGLAAGHDPLCKALFLGGVTRRFPTLNFAFLEGGAGWAINLYTDIVGHWEKRNVRALRENLDPALLDREALLKLIVEKGDERIRAKREQIKALVNQEMPRPESIDDFAACQIEKPEDIRDLFVPRFYFGVEADDPKNALAFNTRVNPFGARLRAVLGSDIGHWDVVDMAKVLEEAHEEVEKGLITEADFKDLVFGNAVRLHGGMNPDFFNGTPVEAEAKKLLAAEGG